MKKMAGNPRVSGFTLIELLVTVAIAAILVSVAAPNMSSLLRGARLSAQSDLLVGSLNTARLEAIKQRVDFTVCAVAAPSTATGCATSTTNWSTGWIIISSANVVLQRFSPKADVTLVTAAASTGVTFNRTLGSAASPPTFTACLPGQKRQVVEVGASGRVSKSIGTTVCS